MTDIGTSLRDALDAMTTTDARPLPPIERVYKGARRRKRRRLAVRAAVVALTGAIAATAVIQRSDSSRLEIADPSGSVLTPLTARLLPQDTLGMQLTFVMDPADVHIDLADRRVTTQLWGRGEVQLAIRTSRSGIFGWPGDAKTEMVPISGWKDPAEVVTYPSGAIVVVVYEDSLTVAIASQTLDRAQLLAVTSSIRVRESGGVDFDASTVPSDFKPMGEDTVVLETPVYLNYGYPSGEGASLRFSVSSQTIAGRAFYRLLEPPATTARVGDQITDVYTGPRAGMFTLVWVAAPDVQVRVEVDGGGAQNEALALRAARSVRTVDEPTWRKVLDTVIETDGGTVTTTAGAGPSTR